ncbi:MAG: DUF3987 domain-containing protein [Burkholderiaceae bacterium]|nr:DUF3987 domain-containing protein [Burkholderiaceae bacterium]
MLDTDTSQAVDALNAIPPDLPHDEWVKVGMGFHDAGGDFDTWNEWSSGAASYQPSAARDAWKSFRHGGGVGAGTLFHIAGEHGYTRSGPPPDRAMIEARKAKAAADKLAHDAQEAQQHQRAAQAAEAALKAAVAAPESHPYLVAKGIKPHGLRTDGGNLLVPMRDTGGKLHSLQSIGPDGDKRFQPGGRVKGCYFAMGKPVGALVIAEGVATGASILECTGHAVAVAFNAGNLLPVAQALRAKYPDLKIIVAADDDVGTSGNPGLTKSTEAALAVGGWLAVPDFGADRPDGASDMNDLHQIAGAAAVKACIEVAAQVSTSSQVVASASTGQTFAPLGDGDGAVEPGTAWPTPEPLPEGLPPVPAFDPALLPDALRGWVADIAHRMQCPMDFPAVGAITALSSLIGARAVVAPKARDDWRVVPNLWGLIVGRPAVMKSPALAQTLGPLNRLQASELEAWKQAHADWELDCKVADMAKDASEKKAKGLASKDPAAARALLQPGDTPAEPQARRFIVNDATVEKLGELLVANPWGTLSFRDELYGLLKSLDKEDQAAARAFMLQAYDGNQGYTFDRILRGTVHIPRVCVAMVGGIQPGRIQEYVRSAVSGGTGDDGLLQRFGLTVWPDIQREFAYIDQWPDTHQKQTAWAVYERLATLLPATDDDPVEWRFSPDAQGIFAEWMVEAKTELRGGELHPALVSHLDKYSKLVPALALIFALVDTPDSGNVIHEGELIRALAWAEYLRPHAERLYSAATTPETTGAAALLKKIQAGKLIDRDGVLLESFTPREVAVKSWGGLASTDTVRKAADVLVDYGWLVPDTVRSGDAKGRGRPSDRYHVNPAAMERGAA